MQYGCNDLNKRIKPSFSGERATCPFCKSELIGKCGEIYAWHWQHAQNNNCDPWKEPETEWHRKWKSYFPEDWQEVIIIKGNEKHIADVQIENGFVIEFQNSPISRSTIREREKFYDDMIWVVNAEKFKSNLKKFSLVKSKLNDNEKRNSEKKKDFETEMEIAESQMESWVSKKDQEISIQEAKFYQHEYEITKLQSILAFKEDITKEITVTWEKDGYYYKHELGDFISKSSELKNECQIICSQLRKLQEQLESCIKQSDWIARLRDYYFDGKNYKIAAFENFSGKNFQILIAIKNGTENLLIPDVLQFSSEEHFNNFKFQKDRYLFAIEAQPIILSKKEYKEQLSRKIIDQQNVLDKFESRLQLALDTYVTSKINERENKKTECKNEIITLKETQARIIENNKSMTQKIQEERNEFYQTETLSVKEQEFQIMKQNKGMYKYWWKNRRPSWDEAENNVFLDLGDDHLYEIINEELLRRILKSEFINQHLS